MRFTPIIEYQRLDRTDGFIRFGEKAISGKTGGSYARSLDKPRLTSNDRALLEQAAAIYGGTVRKWEGGEQLYELYTESEEMLVMVPPQDVEGGACYEFYGQSQGCLRRCDGVECCHFEAGGERRAPCQCDEDTPIKQACKLTLRYKVKLLGITSMGNWRIISHSVYVRLEWPGFLDSMFTQLPHGFLAALAAEFREGKTTDKDGKIVPKHYPVLVLRLRAGILGEVQDRGGVLMTNVVNPALMANEAPALPARTVDQETGEVKEQAPDGLSDEQRAILDAYEAMSLSVEEQKAFKAICKARALNWKQVLMDAREEGVDNSDGLAEFVQGLGDSGGNSDGDPGVVAEVMDGDGPVTAKREAPIA